jgi:thiamine biosynthesis protein ThiC
MINMDKMQELVKNTELTPHSTLYILNGQNEVVASNNPNLCGILFKDILPVDRNSLVNGLKTKINVNLGVSGDCADYGKEFAKVKMSIDMGAESIMDLSNYGKTNTFRKKLIEFSTALRSLIFPRYRPFEFLGPSSMYLSSTSVSGV